MNLCASAIDTCNMHTKRDPMRSDLCKRGFFTMESVQRVPTHLDSFRLPLHRYVFVYPLQKHSRLRLPLVDHLLVELFRRLDRHKQMG